MEGHSNDADYMRQIIWDEINRQPLQYNTLYWSMAAKGWIIGVKTVDTEWLRFIIHIYFPISTRKAK